MGYSIKNEATQQWGFQCVGVNFAQSFQLWKLVKVCRKKRVKGKEMQTNEWMNEWMQSLFWSGMFLFLLCMKYMVVYIEYTHQSIW